MYTHINNNSNSKLDTYICSSVLSSVNFMFLSTAAHGKMCKQLREQRTQESNMEKMENL